jgi:hypothetical protein
MKKLLALVTASFALFFALKDNRLPFFSKISNPVKSNILNADCKVKGNISINSGRKIYHIPGQEDYENTRIQPEHGERWFCSEEEAIKAGWTKAPR